MRALKFAAALFLLGTGAALGQSSPNLQYGQVPTAAQWNSFFAKKWDYGGYIPVNKSGDFMLGKLITSTSSGAGAGLNLPAGTAPSSPVDGDMWTTSAGLYVRAGGTTYGPLTGSGCPTLTGDVTSPGSCVTTLATVQPAKGGTGLTSLTANSVVVGNGSSPASLVTPSASSTRQYLGTSSSGAPAYFSVNFNELGGTLASSQCPAAVSGGAIGCMFAPSSPTPVHQFLNSYNGTVWGSAQPSTSDISGLGTVATKNIGNSVLDAGAGKLEAVWPYEATSTGASKVFTASDLQFATRRSNSGSAMTDTFPASSATGMVNGAVIYVGNGDATAADTITAGSGTVFSAGATQAVTAGRGVMFVLDTTGGTPTWRSHNNDLNQLLSANNLSDVATPATALANLGGIGAASPAFTGTFTAVNGTLTGAFQSLTATIGGASALGELEVAGTYSANPQDVYIHPTFTNNTTSAQQALYVIPQFNPSGASISSLWGAIVRPRMQGSATLAPTTLAAIQALPETLSGYAGTIANGYGFYGADAIVAGTNPFTNFTQFYGVPQSTNGNGATSGTVTNYQFRAGGNTSAPGAGGTMNNYSFFGTVPSGSGAGTTQNYGLRLTGNGGSGGGGTTTNWALFDDSTANVSLLGKVRIGSNTAPTHALDVTGTLDATVLSQAGTVIATGAFLVSDTDTTLAANSNSNVATQRATKAYVDAHAVGLNWKSPVATATTANITLSGEQTIDGVLTSASRVLVKNQSAPAQNGIYVSAAGAWARSSDAAVTADFTNMTVSVAGGTVGAGTQWNCGCVSITVGTTAVNFVQIASAITYSAGSGLTLTANTFALDTTIAATLTGTQTLTNKSIDAGQLTGTIANARLPLAFTATAGAIIPALCPGNNFSIGLDPSTASISCSRPTFANLTATPTTLSGYGITDGQPLSADLTAIAAIASNGILKRTGSGAWSIATSATDYAPATTGSSILKASSGGFANAVGNTDYLAVASPVFTTLLSSPTGSITLTAGSLNIGTGNIGITSGSVSLTSGSLSSGGNVTTVRGGTQGVNIDGPDATYKELLYSVAGSQVWTAGVDKVAESSTRTGANYEICEWANNGTFIDCPLSIARATGIANFVDGATIGGSNILKASDLGTTVQAYDTALAALSTAIHASSPRGLLGTPGPGTVGVTTLGSCLNYAGGGAGTLSLNCTTLAGYSITDAAPIAIFQPFVQSTQFDKAAATVPTNITQLQLTTLSGKTYSFRGKLFVILDAAGGFRFRMNGSSVASSVIYQATFTCDASSGTFNNSGTFQDLTTNFFLPSPGCTAGVIDFDGSAAITTGGTLAPAFSQQVASGTSSAKVGSKVEYSQVN